MRAATQLSCSVVHQMCRNAPLGQSGSYSPDYRHTGTFGYLLDTFSEYGNEQRQTRWQTKTFTAAFVASILANMGLLVITTPDWPHVVLGIKYCCLLKCVSDHWSFIIISYSLKTTSMDPLEDPLCRFVQLWILHWKTQVLTLNNV